MSTAASTPRQRRTVAAFAMTLVVGLTLCATASWTVADASPSGSRPSSDRFVTSEHRPTPSSGARSRPRPVPHRPAAICTTQAYGGVTYCVGTLNGVITGRYGVGSPIAMTFLHVVSVTSANGRTIVTVVDPDPQTPTSTCTPTPGVFCGARTVPDELAIVWPPGSSVPPAPSYIQLYGITTLGSIAPDGYLLISCIGGCDG